MFIMKKINESQSAIGNDFLYNMKYRLDEKMDKNLINLQSSSLGLILQIIFPAIFSSLFLFTMTFATHGLISILGGLELVKLWKKA
jgi:hypothetical protein